MSSIRFYLGILFLCAGVQSSPAQQPPAPQASANDIKVRSITFGVGPSPACLCWSEDGKAFYHVDGIGTVRRIRYPELTEESSNAIGRKCSWVSLSSKGLVASVVGSQEAWLLDPKTLKGSKKIPIQRTQYVVSSPHSPFSYAIEANPNGSGTLTVIDLEKGRAVKQYRGKDLGEKFGIDHPVVSANGESLFATGGGIMYRYKLDGTDVKLEDSTEQIILGRFEGLSISNDGDFVCAPSGGGNFGKPQKYGTQIYASANLKESILTISSGQFPLAIGFDFTSGWVYAQNLKNHFMVFDAKGVKLKEFLLEKDKSGIPVEPRQFLVHPTGRQVLVHTFVGFGPKAESYIFAVELPNKNLAEAKIFSTHLSSKNVGITAVVPDPSLDKIKTDFVSALTEAQKLADAGKYKEAQPLFERALQIAVKSLGEDHANTAVVLHNYAIAYFQQANYREAELLFRRSLAIREKVLTNESPLIAVTLNYLAGACSEQGRHEEAELFLHRCVAIREKVFGKESSSVADAIMNLANLYHKQGKFADAEPLYRRSVTILEKIHGKDQPATAVSIHNLANLHHSQGKYADAEPLYQRSLAIFERTYGKEDVRVADFVSNLASLYADLGKYAEAETLYLRSLKITESAFGKEHFSIAHKLNNLANLYRKQRKYADAEPLYQRCLAIQVKVHGEEHPSVATTIMSLAILHNERRSYAEAERLNLRALSIQEKILGRENHLDVAVTLHNLAVVYHQQEKYAAAEPIYWRCLAIYSKIYGPDNPRVADTLNNLVLLHQQQEKFTDAARLQTQLRKSTRQFMLRELPSLSIREQQALLGLREKTRFAVALSLGQARVEDASIVTESAGWLLNGKAIALEAQTIRSGIEREVTDVEGKAILDELQSIRAQEAFFASKAKQSQPGTVLRAELESRRSVLEKKLAQQSGTAAKISNPWVELTEVRKKIPDGAILIDIARFPGYRFVPKKTETWWSDARYVAWIIPAAGAGDIRIVDLGDATKIDTAIQAARQTLESTVDNLEKRQAEKKLEADAAEKLAAVAKLVFEPLKPHLGKAKKLILSPDGDLWLLPWAALPTAQDRYLIEDYTLRFVVTGRDLVEYAVDKKPTTTAALILADPDYNLTPTEVAEAAPKQKSAPETTLAAQTRGLSDDLRGLGRVKRLPGTAAEAKQAFDKLKTLTGREPKLYQEGEASETIVKATKSPQVLVLATHGYFMKKQEIELKDDAGLELSGEKKLAMLKDKEGKEVENPLLRCGLLLAGANKRALAKDGEDDGVLTGLEIVGLDLRGTQMVVLSACETGVGDVQTGEGVAGLRQAFQLAGAESVLATLWQISDSATSKLMSTFYDELAKGTERSEALAIAQRQFLKDRREKSGAGHPYFWASFTLTGK